MKMNTPRRRKSTCLFLLLTTSCIKSSAPSQHHANSSAGGSRNAGSIQGLTRRFRKSRGEPSATSSASTISRRTARDASPMGGFQNRSTSVERFGSSGSQQQSITGAVLNDVTEPSSDTSHHAAATSPSITSLQPSKPSVTISASSLFALLQNFILSKPPLLRSITLAAQLALLSYLAKASWNVFKEAWDELNEEYVTHYKAEDVREEQDLPFCDDVDNLVEEGDDDASKRYNNRQRKQSTPNTAMRELATRLRSAGIPYASESEEECGRTVESVVKSLTRSEGNVLSQTLLNPDNHGLADDSESDATKSWNAIGGLSSAKESLLDLAFPLLPSQSSSNDYYGGLLANPPGVLLYGPPGCGKSMLVRALANTVGARFLVVSPSCLLRKYVGETNLNVRALFSVAAKISPCVIFVDELDGLFRERGGEDHDVSRDLKTEFLQLWDGIRHHHLQGGGFSGSSSVLVIGATNRPFDVDPAFLRRMPRRIFVGLPDYEARVAVLNNMLQSVPLDASFDIDLVARNTRGYSPSDMREVLQAAALFPLREARAAAVSYDGEGMSKAVPLSIPALRALRTEDVLKALEGAKPTHFSKTYERDLMEYVRRSGGAEDSHYGDQSPTVSDAGAYFANQEERDSDEYSYDDESESDDFS